tara:strand:+ start:314 stop:709 length:396 start_codon:yes stop_codon:yes gene_type:complete
MRMLLFRSRRVASSQGVPERDKQKKSYISTEELTKYLKSLDDNIERSAYSLEQLNNTERLLKSIYCPITNMPMQDPVIAPDGISYEKKAIQEWFTRKNTSPVSGKTFKHTFLIPNHNLRNVISELMKTNAY